MNLNDLEDQLNNDPDLTEPEKKAIYSDALSNLEEFPGKMRQDEQILILDELQELTIKLVDLPLVTDMLYYCDECSAYHIAGEYTMGQIETRLQEGTTHD